MSEPTPPGPRSRPPLGRFLWVAVLVALDLWTKAEVFTWLDRQPGAGPPPGVEVWFNGHWRFPLLGDFLGFLISENRGAAWGVGDQFPHLLVGGRVVASLVLIVLLWRVPGAQPWLRAALTLILAGALGNLHDNLLREPSGDHPYGAVRDFIHVYFAQFDYHFPTFNVADSCITVGAVILIVSGIFGGREARSAERPPDAETAEAERGRAAG
jgi:signal peptidase II